MRYAAAILVAAGVVCLAYSALASDEPPQIAWVVWDDGAGRAWVSPRGYRATATNQTACALATVEAARLAAPGTRISCRRIK